MTWKTLVATLPLIVSLAGCNPKIVYVPVSSCPAPPLVTMPTLMVDQLPRKPETAAALKALAMDYVTLKGTLEQCIIYLDAYRPVPDP